MTVLAVRPVGGTQLAPALACLDSATFARRDGAAFLEVDPAALPRLARALAYGGIEARPAAADLAPWPGPRPAIGVDLTPIRGLDLDVVHLRRLSAGAATRMTLRGRLGGLLPPDGAARGRCRALMRGEYVVFAWARRAWGSRQALRTSASRGALRPAVFDSSAMRELTFDAHVISTDDALARWLFR